MQTRAARRSSSWCPGSSGGVTGSSASGEFLAGVGQRECILWNPNTEELAEWPPTLADFIDEQSVRWHRPLDLHIVTTKVVGHESTVVDLALKRTQLVREKALKRRRGVKGKRVRCKEAFLSRVEPSVRIANRMHHPGLRVVLGELAPKPTTGSIDSGII